MKLYHHTSAGCLPAIDKGGLLPNMRPERESKGQTFGKPVVWLTTEPDAPWLIRNPDCGPECCIGVELSPNTSRLHHYLTWIVEQGSSFLDLYDINKLARIGRDPKMMDRWHIYLGTVSRARLILPTYKILEGEQPPEEKQEAQREYQRRVQERYGEIAA